MWVDKTENKIIFISKNHLVLSFKTFIALDSFHQGALDGYSVCDKLQR